MEWLLIVLTIYLSGFFSGSEIAFVSANRLRLELFLRKNTTAAGYLSKYVSNPESFLITTLVGNNIINVLYATLMTLYLSDPIEHLIERLTGDVPSSLIVLLIQTTIASLIIMYLGEIIPKAIFRSRADSILPKIAIPMQLVEWVLKPFIGLANWASQLLLKAFNVESGKVEDIFRRQDIEMIIQDIQEKGASDIDKEDSELLSNVLELSNKRVKDSMITRTEIVAVEKETPINEVLKAFVSSGYSKLPVYDESIDNIIGVVFAGDLFKRPQTLEEIRRPVKFVPYSKRSRDLLADFRVSNTSMAVVLDEYGGTSGLVTIEDLIEEVVGDIEDEYDTTDQIMKKLNDTTFIFSGTVEIEDIVEKFPEVDFVDDSADYETIAGFIIHHIGRIPKVNEELIIGTKKIIISKASPARIETVRIILLED
ncbi:HlyC/CorC family transporter [bacterium]|nr:MAG: HlyC/CorC family transporter [bacterium]